MAMAKKPAKRPPRDGKSLNKDLSRSDPWLNSRVRNCKEGGGRGEGGGGGGGGGGRGRSLHNLQAAHFREPGMRKTSHPPLPDREPLTEQDLPSPQGYHCNLVSPLTTQLKIHCPSCGGILRDPCQTTCCNRAFCQDCLEMLIWRKRSCPHCGALR